MYQKYEKCFRKCNFKEAYYIKNIKEDMRKSGALGAMMSGSGPTVFAFWWYANSSKSFWIFKRKI